MTENQGSTLEMAQAIKSWLDEHPDQHELEQIVEGTGIDLNHARPILDSWRPDDSADGVAFVGPGQGGPWIELPEPIGYLMPTATDLKESSS